MLINRFQKRATGSTNQKKGEGYACIASTKGDPGTGNTFLQVNVDRSKAAMLLLQKIPEERKIDVLIVTEPTKSLTNTKVWFADEGRDVAIRVLGKDTKVIKKREGGKEYVWVELEEYVVYSCYFSPKKPRKNLKGGCRS